MPKLMLVILLGLTPILAGCRSGGASTSSGATAELDEDTRISIALIKKNMIFVEGGEFLMGAYLPIHAVERPFHGSDDDASPMHTVRLSSYSIAKFKVTNREYQMYLKHNGKTLRTTYEDGYPDDFRVAISSVPNLPAEMDWHEAEHYCKWLAEVSKLPFALPTEAQWEYAARSRGDFVHAATNDGTLRGTNAPYTSYEGDGGPRGINVSTSGDRRDFAQLMGWPSGGVAPKPPLPVDKFPPNPLGLYAMTDNGLEWVKDWYDKDYYQYSPLQDPQGPDGPVTKSYFGNGMKVQRGSEQPNHQWGGALATARSAREPEGYSDKGRFHRTEITARCVVNLPAPVL